MAHEPEQEFPDTSKTYAIILGASKWPEMPKLKASETFTRSAEALRAYLLDDKRGMGLPEDNVLWLFNSEELPANLGLRIRQFLGKSEETNKYAGYDILIYYTGHGAFTQGEQKFQLLVHATRESQFNDTGYRMSSLATDLNAVARQARKYVILDCCHSAAAFGPLQSQNVNGIAEKIVQEQEIDFAEEEYDDEEEYEEDGTELDPSKVKGTALLTACDEDQWALYEDDDNRLTMFTGGLIEALRDESKEGKTRRSIGELYRKVRLKIRKNYGDKAVLPRLYFPKGDEDPMRSIPIFPTPNALEVDLLDRIETLERTVKGLKKTVGDQSESCSAEITDLKKSLANISVEIDRASFEKGLQPKEGDQTTKGVEGTNAPRYQPVTLIRSVSELLEVSKLSKEKYLDLPEDLKDQIQAVIDSNRYMNTLIIVVLGVFLLSIITFCLSYASSYLVLSDDTSTTFRRISLDLTMAVSFVSAIFTFLVVLTLPFFHSSNFKAETSGELDNVYLESLIRTQLIRVVGVFPAHRTAFFAYGLLMFVIAVVFGSQVWSKGIWRNYVPPMFQVYDPQEILVAEGLRAGGTGANQGRRDSDDENETVVAMYGRNSNKQLADVHADQRRLCVAEVGGFGDKTRTAIAIFRRTQANLPTPALDGNGPFFDLSDPAQRVLHRNFQANVDTGNNCETERFINFWEATRLKDETQVKDFTDRANALGIVGVDLKVTKTDDGKVTLNDPEFRTMIGILRSKLSGCRLTEEIYDNQNHITRNLDFAVDEATDDATCFRY